MKLKLFLFIIFSFFIIPFSANAARLYFAPDNASYGTGEKFVVELRLDTEGARVDKIRVVFQYDSSFLKVNKVSEKDSIITNWNSNPDFSQTGNVSNITFDGIVSDSFIGDGLIGKITLSGRQKGMARLVFHPDTFLKAPTQEEDDKLGFIAHPAEFNFSGEIVKGNINIFGNNTILIIFALLILIAIITSWLLRKRKLLIKGY